MFRNALTLRCWSKERVTLVFHVAFEVVFLTSFFDCLCGRIKGCSPPGLTSSPRRFFVPVHVLIPKGR